MPVLASSKLNFTFHITYMSVLVLLPDKNFVFVYKMITKYYVFDVLIRSIGLQYYIRTAIGVISENELKFYQLKCVIQQFGRCLHS